MILSVKDRIKKFIKYQGQSIRSFEESINASNGYINSVSKGFVEDKLNKIIEKYPNLDIQWLLTGKGSMLKSEVSNNLSTIMETDSQYIKGVPFYDLDFTASFLEIQNNQQTKPDSYIQHPFFKGCDYVVRASGQSMAKLIKHGDAIGLIKIENWTEFIPMGEVYAIVTNNGFRMIKIITKGDTKDTFTLISKPSDPTCIFVPSNVLILSTSLSVISVSILKLTLVS